MRIEVAWTQGGGARSRTLDLPAGATVADALAVVPAAVRVAATVSVWGEPADGARSLADGDRVECCVALPVDPRGRRRARARG